MPEITNDRGDTVTVDCGGFGNDNAVGTVEQKDSGGTLTPVPKARVRIINFDTEDAATTRTNNNGEFDEDVNVQTGHRVWVKAEWTDGSGNRHVVSGTVTLDCDDDEKKSGTTERVSLKDLEFLERFAFEAARVSDRAAEESNESYMDSLRALVDLLRGLNGMENREDQQELIDDSIRKELALLLEKLYRLPSHEIPPPKKQWEILIEVMKLLLKLVAKSFWLQKMRQPDFLPNPPGGGGPGGGGGPEA